MNGKALPGVANAHDQKRLAAQVMAVDFGDWPQLDATKAWADLRLDNQI